MSDSPENKNKKGFGYFITSLLLGLGIGMNGGVKPATAVGTPDSSQSKDLTQADPLTDNIDFYVNETGELIARSEVDLHTQADVPEDQTIDLDEDNDLALDLDEDEYF